MSENKLKDMDFTDGTTSFKYFNPILSKKCSHGGKNHDRHNHRKRHRLPSLASSTPRLMLQQKELDDYVIATNETHSVREFVEKAFDVVGLDWQEYVEIDDRFLRPLDVNFLKGDYSKARNKLGWKPKVRFNELVKIMVKEDMDRWEKWQNGERFPWDAQNYPNENKILSRKINIER